MTPLQTVLLGLFAQLSCAQAFASNLLEVLETTPFGTSHPVLRCDASGANFGASVLEFSFSSKAVGCAIFAEPRNACTPPVKLRPVNTTLCDTYFAVVSRGNCTFSEKAYNVQQALPVGFDAIVIYNDKDRGAPQPMTGSKHAADVDIPVVMISWGCMKQIMGTYSADKGFTVTLKALPGYYDLIKYLVPFVVIVGFCFIILFISLVIRLCRERRRLARKRLSRANLKKIPVTKYKKGEGPETCAICLEDFQENEKIRMLPCRHAYHQKCIDPWLTKNRKVCPICKRKVGPSTGSDSSDSETERNTANNSTIPSTSRDSDPLLNNVYNSSSSSNRNGQTTSTTASDSRPSIFRLRWLSYNPDNNSGQQAMTVTAPTPNAPPPPSESSQQPAAPAPNFTTSSSANLTAENDGREADAQSVRGPATLGRRLNAAFTRTLASLRRLARRESNTHRRLENDASSVSEIVLDADLENPASLTMNRFASENAGYANSVDGNSLTTVHSNHYYVQADVEPVPNEHRDA